LPKGLKKIGENAFQKTKLKSVKLPAKIKEIGGWAFAWTDISRIELPDNFEIKSQLTEDNKVTYVVKKNSKAHKAFLEFAKTYVDGYWKLKFK
ncbi:MAG: leucine-rich repeat protein, partial [Lachnospiraceae bacterium]|nr:leucine-rich repeat protein [Lachnospiraceae bacterium]